MIVDSITNKNDEYYTPGYAIKPILKYINSNSVIWCPFDTEESLYVKLFERSGHKVVYTHIKNGNDFFSTEPPDGCNYIISNPPYSVKGEVLQRLFDIGIPFAMLVGVVGLFESEKRYNMFKSNDFEIMYFNKRISYMKGHEEKPSINPPFSSVYVCHNMLPKQICFEEIKK
jgi:hypothetical protein